MIEAECRNLVELVGERVFTNLHMLDVSFPFERVLKKPEPEEAAEASSKAVVDHMEAHVKLYRRGTADDEETSQALLPTASSSSGDYTDAGSGSFRGACGPCIVFALPPLS